MANMVALKLLSVFLMVLGLAAQQVASGKHSSEEKVSVSYDGVFGATPVKIDIATLLAHLTSYRTTVREYSFTVGKTQTIAELGKVAKSFALKAANVLIGYVEALENIVSSGNVPSREVFEHYEKPYHKLKKFFASDAPKFAHELDELIGCPPSREFKLIFKSLDHQVEFIAQSIHNILEAVESGKDKREYVQRQAMIISNRVVKLSKIVKLELAKSVEQLAERIEAANGLVSTTLLGNSTKQVVDGFLRTTRSAVVNMTNAALNVYVAGQLGIRKNLSMSIEHLSVYKNYRVLSHLTHEIEESYDHLFHYLHTQNNSDIDHIKKYYNKTAVNSVNVINNITESFLDVAQHTVLEFIDFFLEGRISEKCQLDYQIPLLKTYEEFTSNITECLHHEIANLNQTVQAFSCSVGQLQSSTNKVAASLARCARSASCDTPTPPPVPTVNARSVICIGGPNPTVEALAYAKTKACLKTNLHDMRLLTGILKPQFEHVDRLIKLDVAVSKFRLENCMKVRLHELVAKLKTLRVLIRGCMQQIDECPVEQICDDDARGGKCHPKESGEDSHEKGLLRRGFFEEEIPLDE